MTVPTPSLTLIVDPVWEGYWVRSASERIAVHVYQDRPRAWHLLQEVQHHFAPFPGRLYVITSTAVLQASHDLPPSGVSFVIVHTIANRPDPPLQVDIRFFDLAGLPGAPVHIEVLMYSTVGRAVDDALNLTMGPPPLNHPAVVQLRGGEPLPRRLMAAFAVVAHEPHWDVRPTPARTWIPGHPLPGAREVDVLTTGMSTIITFTPDGVCETSDLSLSCPRTGSALGPKRCAVCRRNATRKWLFRFVGSFALEPNATQATGNRTLPLRFFLFHGCTHAVVDNH